MRREQKMYPPAACKPPTPSASDPLTVLPPPAPALHHRTTTTPCPALHHRTAATMLESMRAPATPRLESTFPSASPDALDLLARLMHFNPDRRISPEDALRHPYCAQFHNPQDEPTAPATITIPIDDNTKVCAGRGGRAGGQGGAPQLHQDLQRPCLTAPALPYSTGSRPAALCPASTYDDAAAAVQYSIGEYRDRLYLEIVKRKKEIRRAMKEREAARAASRSKSRSSSAAVYPGSSSGYGHAAAAPVRH